MLLGPALGGVRHPDVDMWMAAKGATGAAALLDFAGQKYGLRNAAGVPRWGSVTADMTFTRASAAGRWPASGPYEMISSGVLRHDHDPVTREPLGVRIEGAATNLLTNSEIQNGLAGMSSALNATAITDFEGGRTGLRLNNAASTATAYKPVTATAGAIYTIACDVEMEDGAPPVFGGAVNSAFNTFAFNLGGSFYVPSRVEKIGVQVWRCFFSGAFGSTRPDAGVAQYQTNEQRRFKVTGFQLEADSLASSYIVTGAGAVTRASERLYLDLPFDPATEGVTFLWDGVLPSISSRAPVALVFMRPSGAIDRLQLYSTTSGFGVVGALDPTGFWAPAPPWRTFVAGERRRVVARLTPATLSLSQNGDAVTTAALTGVIPSGMTRLHMGNLAGGNQWRSTISRVAAWEGAPFSDAQMRELSAL